VLPPSFSQTGDERRYPVAVVFDGEVNVPTLASVSEELTRQGLIPEKIFVAIEAARRGRLVVAGKPEVRGRVRRASALSTARPAVASGRSPNPQEPRLDPHRMQSWIGPGANSKGQLRPTEVVEGDDTFARTEDMGEDTHRGSTCPRRKPGEVRYGDDSDHVSDADHGTAGVPRWRFDFRRQTLSPARGHRHGP
jgi:hypothetical protein